MVAICVQVYLSTDKYMCTDIEGTVQVLDEQMGMVFVFVSLFPFSQMSLFFWGGVGVIFSLLSFLPLLVLGVGRRGADIWQVR